MSYPKLTDAELAAKWQSFPGWASEGEVSKWIFKKYRFREFMTGIAFVNEVARTAEALNHHPMIAIDYKMVTLRLTTWSAGGLTELDFQSAAEYDRAYEQGL
jgi:4a-hydroxytetrahydrobiopterin dehydratase